MSDESKDGLDDDAVAAACRMALSGALGAPDSEIGRLRLRNLEYYNAEPVGELGPPEIEDRSDFVATDVADTVEGMLPQIMRMFVSSDDAVEFEAREGGQQAGVEAKLATAFVNHIFYTRNDGVGIIYDWFKDALIQKVGFVKVWVEEDSEDSEQTFEGSTPDQITMLMQEGWELKDDPERDEQGLTFTVCKKGKAKTIKVAVCAPHEVRIDPNARWGDDPAMIAHVFYKRRFELEEEGYDLSDIGGGNSTGAGDSESLAMLGDGQSGIFTTLIESHQLYECAEVYIRLDVDGDGVAEWRQCFLIEQHLMDHAKVDGHPFVWICPIPRPHSFFGDCPADFAIQPQKMRTNLVRAIQDNLYLSVNQRTYLNTDAQVNISDWLENRPGGVVRGKGPANLAIQPIVQPNLGQPAYEFNEWLSDWSSKRTGWTAYSQGLDADSLNKTATGVSIITQKADMRMDLMSRFFAVGMKALFAKVLKLATRHQGIQEMVNVGGQFVPINPSEYRNQFNVKIKVGLGTGSKEQQAARIMGLMQIMQAGVQMGVVGPQNIAEAIRLYVEANEFKNPERFVSPEPSGMPPNPEAFQQMQQQFQQQMEGMQGELQRMGQENDGLKQQAASRDAEMQLKGGELQLKGAEFDLKRQEAEHRASMDMTASMASGDLTRAQGETEQMGMQAFAEAAQLLAVAAQAIISAQAAPRALQITGPSGQVYSGISGQIEQRLMDIEGGVTS